MNKKLKKMTGLLLLGTFTMSSTAAFASPLVYDAYSENDITNRMIQESMPSNDTVVTNSYVTYQVNEQTLKQEKVFVVETMTYLIFLVQLKEL